MKSRRWFLLMGCFLTLTMLMAVLVAGCDSTTSTSDGGTTSSSADATTSSSASADGSVTTSGTDGSQPDDGVPRSILECPQGPPDMSLTPQYGGTLVILHQYAPSNLGACWEPQRFMDIQMLRFAVECLVGLDGNGDPVPQLAESWDTSDDYTTITFHLRQGVKFHDGTDFNAEAVEWNFQMQIDGAKTDLDNIVAMDILDEYTFRVTLSEPDALFVQRLNSSQCGKITSPAAYDLYGAAKVKKNPVGTGPFKLKSFDFPSSIDFERFDDYWQEGLPYLDGVKIVTIPDYQSRKTAFLNGEGDILYTAEFVDMPEFEAVGASVEARIMALVTLAGNSIDPASPSNDIRMRQALTYAIDVPTIVDGVYEGFTPYTNQIALEDRPGYNPDIVGYPYDPDKARDLLAQVGITPDTPWETDLTYLSTADYDQVYTVVKDYLGKVGIEVNLTPVDYPTWNAVNEKGWEGLGAMSLSYNSSVSYTSMLKQYLSEDAYLFGNHLFIPEEFNAVYRDVLVETDADKRNELYQELNKMAIDDYCLLTPLYALTGTIGVASEVKDNVWCVNSSGEFPVERIWLEQD